MTKIGTKGLVAAAAVLVLSVPIQGWAAAPQASAAAAAGIGNMVVAQAAAADSAAPADQGGLSDATKQGIGCIVGATSALGYAAYVAGATETLMIAAGGLLAPSVTPTLWLGLTATVAAATCSMGAAATPAVLWAVEQKDNIGANLSFASGQLVSTIAEASNAAVTKLFVAAPAEKASRQVAERPDAAR